MPMIEYMENGGSRYAWRRWGDRQAPAVVLVAGLGLTMDSWPEALVRGLLQEGFQVVTPDNRDAGCSSRLDSWKVERSDVIRAVVRTLLGLRVEGEYALEDMALDVERLLDVLGIRRVHVVGFSMGGMIAQVLACQCPNRVATLTSISSAAGNPRTGIGRPGILVKMLGLQPCSTPEDVRRHARDLLERLSGPKYRPDPGEADRMAEEAVRGAFDLEATRRQLIALLTSGNRMNALRQLRMPTLVIHGTEDPLLPLVAGREVAGCIPGARMVEVDGLGHQLPPGLMPDYAAWISGHCHAHPA